MIFITLASTRENGRGNRGQCETKNQNFVKAGKALAAVRKEKQRQLLKILEKNKPALEASEIGTASENHQVKNEIHREKLSTDISGKKVTCSQKSNLTMQAMNFMQEPGYIMLAVDATELIYLIITEKNVLVNY